MRKSSFIHGKPNLVALVQAARDLLDIPYGGKVPKWSFRGVEYTLEEAEAAFGELPIPGLVLLKAIHADVAANGTLGASPEHRRCFTHTYGCALDDDPNDVREWCPMSALEHPTNKGQYHFPDSPRLQAALANPTARARCSSAALAALDNHAANAGPLPEDWTPPGLG